MLTLPFKVRVLECLYSFDLVNMFLTVSQVGHALSHL
jgi:hypothetical protein